MSLLETRKYIDVLSCEDNTVVVPGTGGKSFLLRAGTIENPTVYPIPAEEIKYINSNCNVFKNGVLRFRNNEADELYEELGINNKEDILFIEAIDDILLSPTADGLKRLLDITGRAQFERVRGRYYFLKNNGRSIDIKVAELIESRYKELLRGKVRTSLSLVPRKDEASSSKQLEEASALIKQQQDMLAAYAAQMEEMKKQLANLAAVQDVASSAESSPPAANKKKPIRKKAAPATKAE